MASLCIFILWHSNSSYHLHPCGYIRFLSIQKFILFTALTYSLKCTLHVLLAKISNFELEISCNTWPAKPGILIFLFLSDHKMQKSECITELVYECNSLQVQCVLQLPLSSKWEDDRGKEEGAGLKYRHFKKWERNGCLYQFCSRYTISLSFVLNLCQTIVLNYILI